MARAPSDNREFKDIQSEIAVELSSPNYVENLPLAELDNLGHASYVQFKQAGKLADILEAISAQQKAVELTPPGHADLPNRLNSLGNSFLAWFNHTGELRDIQEAISLQQKAAELTPSGHVDLPNLLNSLGNSFLARFKYTGAPGDIQEAMSMHRKAVKLTSSHHADLHRRLNSLGSSFLARFRLTQDFGDIDEAISTQQKSVRAAPPGDQEFPAILNDLGISFLTRFMCMGDLADVGEAISAQQKAVKLTPPGYADLHHKLNDLGISFLTRFEYTGDLADLQEALSLLRKATELTPSDHVFLPSKLNNLGNSLIIRFERIGDLADIRESISVQQKAVALTNPSHADLPSWLNNLGISFQTQFQYTGDLGDIQEAISAQQKAVELTPPGHAYLPTWLSNLGNSYSVRFDHMGDFGDIQEAISVQQNAVDLTPPHHADLPGRLINLASSLSTRFRHTNDLGDIQAAISVQQRAVGLTPPSHADLPSFLHNLGNSYITRFHHTRELADVQEATSVLRKSVKLAPPGHTDLPGRLNSLANALLTQFEQSGDLANILEAIAVQRRAVDLTPSGHADLPNRLCNLGQLYVKIWSKNTMKDNETMINAIGCFCRAANSPTGPPSVRLSAARTWAHLCRASYPQQTLSAFAKAIELLPLAAGLEQTVQSRHQRLADTSDISLEAAAAAFSLGKAEKALEWLEQGRCIVWNQLNILRTPIDSLRAHDQGLASRILDVSRSLERAGSRTIQSVDMEVTMKKKMSLQAEASQHIKLAQEWDRLLQTVRGIPGFETFLLPSPAPVLLDGLPAQGPTVIINIAKDRCDALVLFSNPRRCFHVPLIRFSYRKASDLRKCLTKSLTDANVRARGTELQPLVKEGSCVNAEARRGARQSTHRGGRPSREAVSMLKVVLRDLWVDVVKPIIGYLGYSSLGRSEEKPRIWWCATGPLTFLPLHAAGIYDKSNGPKTSDFAISSYTPSVGALTQVTQRTKNPLLIGGGVQGMFMVSQTNTPGQCPIPATAKEIRIVQNRLAEHGVPYFTLEGRDASVEASVANIEKYSSAHLACHAGQGAVDPLKSCFFLHDGPLELSTVIKANLKNADLAFLSACQTSRGDEKLSEEAVHLAAGMLAAGYRSVVATMWSIRDDCAPKIADLFYKQLLVCVMRTGGKGIDGSHAAYALHQAIEDFRQSLPSTESSLLTWIPYVHFGL